MGLEWVLVAWHPEVFSLFCFVRAGGCAIVPAFFLEIGPRGPEAGSRDRSALSHSPV